MRIAVRVRVSGDVVTVVNFLNTRGGVGEELPAGEAANAAVEAEWLALMAEDLTAGDRVNSVKRKR